MKYSNLTCTSALLGEPPSVSGQGGCSQSLAESKHGAEEVAYSYLSFITGLREVADAGAELIQLHLLFDDIIQMERLAIEVIPELI